MKDLRKAVMKDVDPHTARYMRNGTRPLPTELIDAVEGLLAYQKLTGKGWHGAKDYVGRGQMYMPEVPGFPFSVSNGMLTMKAYGLRFSSYLRRGGSRTCARSTSAWRTPSPASSSSPAASATTSSRARWRRR